MTKSAKARQSKVAKSKPKNPAKPANKDKQSPTRPLQREREAWWQRAIRYAPAWLGLVLIMLLFLYDVIGDALPFGDEVRHDILRINTNEEDTAGVTTGDPSQYGGIYNADAPLSRFFADAVMYWEPKIYEWAQEHQLNPNLVATVMQIESCGHPYAESVAAAQGLFQVIPSNFQIGDNQLDPEQNADTGLQIMRDCLYWTTDLNLDQVAESEPNVGLALVCYNGGPSLIYRNRSEWYTESENYYTWGTGIWGDASRGAVRSETLEVWLNSGGSLLCGQAINALRTLDPLNQFQ